MSDMKKLPAGTPVVATTKDSSERSDIRSNQARPSEVILEGVVHRPSEVVVYYPPEMVPAKAEEKIERKRKKRSFLSRLTLPAGPRVIKSAEKAFAFLSTLLPTRIANEEIGDALELIHQLVEAGRPKWFIWTKVVTTFWWASVHTCVYYVEKALGIKKAVTGMDSRKD